MDAHGTTTLMTKENLDDVLIFGTTTELEQEWTKMESH